ncbi:LysM peptidoglycan-binding domain-containing protein, partial [Aetokthonos hydrillicola]
MYTGELAKVKIQVYKDKGFKFKDEGKEFDLPINPEQISQSFNVEYDSAQTPGSKGNNPQFKFTEPEELKLNFTFDGTGVVRVKGQANEFHKDVAKQVQEFLNVVYTMVNKTHRPNFLCLLWGNFSFGNKNGFNCILKNLQINYTLFSSDGKPLRAKINATFVSYDDMERCLREEG